MPEKKYVFFISTNSFLFVSYNFGWTLYKIVIIRVILFFLQENLFCHLLQNIMHSLFNKHAIVGILSAWDLVVILKKQNYISEQPTYLPSQFWTINKNVVRQNLEGSRLILKISTSDSRRTQVLFSTNGLWESIQYVEYKMNFCENMWRPYLWMTGQ